VNSLSVGSGEHPAGVTASCPCFHGRQLTLGPDLPQAGEQEGRGGDRMAGIDPAAPRYQEQQNQG
jgi:hypothetical protein